MTRFALRLGSAAAALAMLAADAAGAASAGRVVRCRVESASVVALNGPCRFLAGGDGSFSLASADAGKPLYGEILDLSVTLLSPGAAEVRGLTRAGVNSRWGEARRSARDRACWEGADFRICAW